MKDRMYKIILCILIMSLLTGCSPFFNLSNYTIPDDAEFLAVIERENTPKKFCAYMKENYEWKLHFLNYSPYKMWRLNTQTRVGDCNDMSCSVVFAMNYNGYETYQIWVFYEGEWISHALGVFVENGKYTYSSNYNYHPIYANSFREIVEHHFTYQRLEFKFYRVYNYNNKLIETGK